MRKPTQEQIIKFYHENTVIDFLEVEVVPTPDGEARLELCADSRHANLYSMAHGGVLTTMADTAMGAKCLALNKKVVTISLNIEFMHAVMTNTPRVFTEAKVLHDVWFANAKFSTRKANFTPKPARHFLLSDICLKKISKFFILSKRILINNS